LYPRQGGVQGGVVVDGEALVGDGIALFFRIERLDVGVWYVVFIVLVLIRS
jgi:hypothetical protein